LKAGTSGKGVTSAISASILAVLGMVRFCVAEDKEEEEEEGAWKKKADTSD
jgi:hypothetical protein